jgi:hypothetical protein
MLPFKTISRSGTISTREIYHMIREKPSVYIDSIFELIGSYPHPTPLQCYSPLRQDVPHLHQLDIRRDAAEESADLFRVRGGSDDVLHVLGKGHSSMWVPARAAIGLAAIGLAVPCLVFTTTTVMLCFGTLREMPLWIMRI